MAKLPQSCTDRRRVSLSLIYLIHRSSRVLPVRAFSGKRFVRRSAGIEVGQPGSLCLIHGKTGHHPLEVGGPTGATCDLVIAAWREHEDAVDATAGITAIFENRHNRDHVATLFNVGVRSCYGCLQQAAEQMIGVSIGRGGTHEDRAGNTAARTLSVRPGRHR
jgi:hypothetical protein